MAGHARGITPPPLAIVVWICYAMSGTDKGQASTVLCIRYELSGTDLGHAATVLCFSATRYCHSVRPAPLLRTSYAVTGTEVEYGPTRGARLPGYKRLYLQRVCPYAPPTRSPVLTYAMLQQDSG
eukprot:3936798-Rhodomonas_salina.4